MTFNEIEKEYWETFDINQGTDKINGYPVIKISDTYSRPATVEDFESFLKQSFIKYLQSEVERLEKEKNSDEEIQFFMQGHLTSTDRYVGGKFAGANEAIDNQITHLQAQIKELKG